MGLHEYERKQNFLGYTVKYDSLLSTTEEQDVFNSLIYQSNYIEGIRDYWSDFHPPEKLPPTLTSHKSALEYTVNESLLGMELNREEVRILHGKLMEGLLKDKFRGHYRKEGIEIRNTIYDARTRKVLDVKLVRRCPKPESVPYLMKAYEQSVRQFENNPDVSHEDLLENHAYFEWIHPFVDGNGRVGRLMLNWLSLKHRKEFFIIESSKRKEYYAFLNSFEQKFKAKHPRI